MQFLKKHITELCFMLLLCGTLWGAVQLIVSGHIFNGDFALYIRQAQSIQYGDVQQVFSDMKEMIANSTYQRYSPVLYPWGYPLLLFPCVVLFGINYFAFKIVGIICLVGAFTFIYYHPILSKERFRMTALPVLALLTGNIFYWGYVNSVSSELPFFCFLMFSFWAMNKLYASKVHTERRIILYICLGILLFFTAQIRTEGYFLFISLIALQWKNRLLGWKFFLPYASALCFWLVFTLVFPSGYTEHFEHFKVVTLTNLLHNIQTFYEYPAQILYIPFSLFNLFFWVNCLLGLYVSSRKLTAESVYLLSTIMLLICWPYDVIRYWLPLFPLCFIFFIQGFRFMCMVWGKKAGKWVLYPIIGILICSVWKVSIKYVTSPIQIYTTINPNVEGESAQEMYTFLRTNTAKDDWIACGESRSIYLYTNRLSCNISGEISNLPANIDWYVEFLYRGSYLQYPHGVIRLNHNRFQQVFRNQDFAIYKILTP